MTSSQSLKSGFSDITADGREMGQPFLVLHTGPRGKLGIASAGGWSSKAPWQAVTSGMSAGADPGRSG